MPIKEKRAVVARSLALEETNNNYDSSRGRTSNRLTDKTLSSLMAEKQASYLSKDSNSRSSLKFEPITPICKEHKRHFKTDKITEGISIRDEKGVGSQIDADHLNYIQLNYSTKKRK